jgi:hypothetical protein
MYSLNKQSIVLAGNSGRLCIGGGTAIRRLPGVNSGAGTTFTFPLDYTALSTAGAILPGSTWNFQAWFRKLPGSTETTNGLEISFVN